MHAGLMRGRIGSVRENPKCRGRADHSTWNDTYGSSRVKPFLIGVKRCPWRVKPCPGQLGTVGHESTLVVMSPPLSRFRSLLSRVRIPWVLGFGLVGALAPSLLPVHELAAQDGGGLPLLEAAAAAPSDLYLRINLPAFELDVVEGRERIRTYPVSLGQLGYETHPGRYESARVEWNPWWYPPASPWARGRSVTAPGPNNPMGRARIHLLDALYIHGSAEPMGDLLSHACIRLTNDHVLELARIVARHRLPDLTLEEIQAYEARTGNTQIHRLSEPLTVRVAYELLEERDGQLRALPDIYARGDAGAIPWLRRLHPQVALSEQEVAAWMELATQEERPVSLEEFQVSGRR